MEDSTDDCDAAIEDSAAEFEDVAVVTGTGIAVTPSEPVEVLSVKAEPEGVEMGTMMTVVPEEPVTVLEPEIELEVKLTTAVPEDELRGTAEADVVLDPELISEPEVLLEPEREAAEPLVVAGVGTTVMPPEPMMVLEPDISDALPEEELSVVAALANTLVGNSDASDDAALDRTLEN
ncbi:hypothetical protein LTR08_003280 [Meristemomyces frigidus]|nr:hypothetical protein LTR08_003280 [Meristemomyces frigidus]